MMNYPIPQPKKIEFTGGFVAAAFDSEGAPSIFAPALAEKTWTSYRTSDAVEFEKRRDDLYPLLKQLFRA